MEGDADRPTGNGYHGDCRDGTSPTRVALSAEEKGGQSNAEPCSPNKEGFANFSGLIAQTEASMRDKLSTLIMSQPTLSKSDTEYPEEGHKVVRDPDSNTSGKRELSEIPAETELREAPAETKLSEVSAMKTLSPSTGDTECPDIGCRLVQDSDGWDLNTDPSVARLNSENRIPSSEETNSETLPALEESANAQIVTEMTAFEKLDPTTENTNSMDDLQDSDMQKMVTDDIHTGHVLGEREINVDAESKEIRNTTVDTSKDEVTSAMQEKLNAASSEMTENKEHDANRFEVLDAIQENKDSACRMLNNKAVDDSGKDVTDTTVNRNSSISSEHLTLTTEIEGSNTDISLDTMDELHLPAVVDKEDMETETEVGAMADLDAGTNNNSDAVTASTGMHEDISELRATSAATSSKSDGLALNMTETVQMSSIGLIDDHVGETSGSVSVRGTGAADVRAVDSDHTTMEDVETRRPLTSPEVVEADDNKSTDIAEYTSNIAGPDQTDNSVRTDEEDMDVDETWTVTSEPQDNRTEREVWTATNQLQDNQTERKVWTATSEPQDNQTEHRVEGTTENIEEVSKEVSVSKQCDNIDKTEHTGTGKLTTCITDHKVVNDEDVSGTSHDAVQDVVEMHESIQKNCHEKIIDPKAVDSNTLVDTDVVKVRSQSKSGKTDLDKQIENCVQASKTDDSPSVCNDQICSKNVDISSNDSSLSIDQSKSSSWCDEGGLMITDVRSLSHSDSKLDNSGEPKADGRETVCAVSTNQDKSSEQVKDSPTVSTHSVSNGVSLVQNINSETTRTPLAATVEASRIVSTTAVTVTTSSKQTIAITNNAAFIPLHSLSSQSAASNIVKSVSMNSDTQTNHESQKSLGKEANSLPVISNVFTVKKEIDNDEEYGVRTSAVRYVPTAIETVVPPTVPKAVPTLHPARVVTTWKGATVNPPKIIVTKMPAGTSVSTLQNKLQSLQNTSVYKGVPNTSPSVLKKTAQISLIPHSQKISAGLNVKKGNKTVPVLVNVTKSASGQRILVPVPSTSTNALPIEKLKIGPVSKDNPSVLNIETIGASRITELIARKNPIPIFKPDPPPNSVQDYRTYPCYECGDAFNHESSLAIHTSRCSMKLSYKCDMCNQNIAFTNKCQLLGHLRFHMNLDKSQAVPIHIKSDSIAITTFYKELVKGNQYKWHSYKESSLNDQGTKSSQAIKPGGKSQDDKNAVVYRWRCAECSQIFDSAAHLAAHFQGILHGKVSKHNSFFCDSCPIYLKTKCAMAAHKRLHHLAEKDCPNLVCPECGMVFALPAMRQFLDHILTTCFHLSRLNSFRCLKCQALISSTEGIEQHLMLNMEHYYKCQLCPMALKHVMTFHQHFTQKHSDIETTSYKTYAKIIYRCHVCDSLMDDKAFLKSHLENHLLDMKTTAFDRWHCLRCGQNFSSTKTVAAHFKSHDSALFTRKAFCTFCSKGFPTYYHYVQHTMACHTKCLPDMLAKFCTECGLVCYGHAQYQSHVCLGAEDIIAVLRDEALKTMKAAEKKKTVKKKIASKPESSVQYDSSSTGISSDNPNLLSKTDIPDHLSKTCRSCGLLFYSAANRTNHIKSHRDFQIYICPWCDRMDFKSYHDLRSHEIACEAIDKIPEYSTMKGTGKRKRNSDKQVVKSGAKSIKAEVKPEPTLKCDHCSLLFTRKSLQEAHMKLEHGFHPCHLCGLIFHSQSTLKKHIMLNHEGKKLVYYCWVCRSRKIYKHFSEKSRLEKHLGSKHRLKGWDSSKIVGELPGLDGSGGSPEPPSIPQTENKDSSDGSPAMKKLRVQGEATFKCAKCSFTSETKEPFLEHISVHKAADTVQCFECGLCFAVFSSLKKHLFMVHKVRDFETYLKDNQIEEKEVAECDIEIDDIEREPIKREPVEESEEEEEVTNPLECKVCYKMFDSEHLLRSHMRNHGMAFIKKSRRRTSGLLQKTVSADSSTDIAAKSQGGNKRSDQFANEENDINVDVIGEPGAKKRRTEIESFERNMIKY